MKKLQQNVIKTAHNVLENGATHSACHVLYAQDMNHVLLILIVKEVTIHIVKRRGLVSLTKSDTLVIKLTLLN